MPNGRPCSRTRPSNRRRTGEGSHRHAPVPARSAPAARPIEASTCPGLVTASSGPNTVPALKRPRRRSPTAMASRVLPTPPGQRHQPYPGPLHQTGHLIEGPLPPEQRRRAHRQRARVAAARPRRHRSRAGPGGEPLAQQHRQVITDQPAQLTRSAEMTIRRRGSSLIRATRSDRRGSRSGAGAVDLSRCSRQTPGVRHGSSAAMS
jgi:hypothetical protein